MSSSVGLDLRSSSEEEEAGEDDAVVEEEEPRRQVAAKMEPYARRPRYASTTMGCEALYSAWQASGAMSAEAVEAA